VAEAFARTAPKKGRKDAGAKDDDDDHDHDEDEDENESEEDGNMKVLFPLIDSRPCLIRRDGQQIRLLGQRTEGLVASVVK